MWRKEKVANEEIGTELRVGQPFRTQRRGGARSSFQASRDSSQGPEESERAVQQLLLRHAGACAPGGRRQTHFNARRSSAFPALCNGSATTT